MKVVWRGQWKGGEITLEVSSVDELVSNLSELEAERAFPDISSVRLEEPYPEISGNVGCAEAVRIALGSSWGKSEPRTKAEIEEVLETNGLYFPDATLRSSLSKMNRKGELRRVKKGPVWGYIVK